MIFDPADKRVRRLFKPRHLFPIFHLSTVEWQVLVPVFTSLIMWLEASTFIKLHGLHSLTKHGSPSCEKTMNVINILYTIDCISIQKEDANIKRDIENKLIFHNVWNYFNVY